MAAAPSTPSTSPTPPAAPPAALADVPTTPCPHCTADIPVAQDDEGACPACGARVRFVDAPERPCDGCKAPVAVPPGAVTVSCASCGLLQAAEAGRGVVVEVRCPRCRRRIRLPADAEEAVCGHCEATMRVKQG